MTTRPESAAVWWTSQRRSAKAPRSHEAMAETPPVPARGWPVARLFEADGFGVDHDLEVGQAPVGMISRLRAQVALASAKAMSCWLMFPHFIRV